MKKKQSREEYDVMGSGEDQVEDLAVMGSNTAQDNFANQVLGVFPKDSRFDKERDEDNAELIQIIGQYLYEHPGQRFSQALRNLDIIREHRMANPSAPCDWVNEFNTEPKEMIRRARLARKKMRS